MPNTLTGDFDAVLEVSVGTLRRLVASMHQNSFADNSKPSIPHVAYFRVDGDSGLVAEHGSVAAQIGVPYVHLIDGSTDRIRVEIGIRANYRPDPGSAPLADIIHGTIHADYSFQDIDPNCFGWRNLAADYLWLRVVKDSVSFEGSVFNESLTFDLVRFLDEATIKAHLTKHIVYILSTQFAPRPQPLARRYRRLRCLVHGDGSAQSAVAIAYGLHGETPRGNLGSMVELFLDGYDFGLAVSSDYVISMVQPMLDPIVGIQRDIFNTWDAGVGGGMTMEYHVRIDGATATWLGPFSLPFLVTNAALIRIRVDGVGWCSRLYRSGVYNVGSIDANDLAMTFSADQLIVLTFDASAERLSVAALGDPSVSVDYNGPFAGEVKSMAINRIFSEVKTNVTAALNGAQSALDALSLPDARTSLSQQVGRVVENAAARFDNAAFRFDGMVLRGTISVQHSYAPLASFEKTPLGDGFDAIASWIPGGRVDKFEWSWGWFTSAFEKAAGSPGTQSDTESYFLRRPQAPRGKYGLALPTGKPLPGLDGSGRVCLTISGARVDSVTGELVPIVSEMDCATFGSEFKVPYEVNGPYFRVCDPLRQREGTPREIAVVRIGVKETAEAMSNTLVLYMDESWNKEAVAALKKGLEQCPRSGYGLRVVLLFKDGVLSRVDHGLQGQVNEVAKRLSASLMIAEDVYGGWAHVLSLPTRHGGIAWRLMSPAGLVTWAHDGHAEGDLVSSALEQRLEPSHPAGFARIRPGVVLDRFPVHLADAHCPPVPQGTSLLPNSKVVFVHKDALSTRETLEQLRREQGAQEKGELFVAVVVEGATAREAEELRATSHFDFTLLPDPKGDITRRAGVRVSPTTMMIDGMGRIARVQIGAY